MSKSKTVKLRSITIKNVPPEVYDKWAKVKSLIKDKVYVNAVIPYVLEEVCDLFIKNPDIKKYMK
jgi:hypothetical protein